MREDIYEMKLHDEIGLDKNTNILRVAGGWIYKSDCENGTGGYDMSSVFVPFDDEFQKHEGIGPFK